MSPRSGSPRDGVSIELYVRSLSPRESRRRIESIACRLDTLVDDGAVAHYRVLPTGRELPARPADAVTDYGRYLLRRVAAFREWAAETGRCLDAQFERHTVESSFTGESHDALVVPTVVMAEYDDQDLRFVTPCGDGSDHLTVQDRLDHLLADGTVSPAEQAPSPGEFVSFEPTT